MEPEFAEFLQYVAKAVSDLPPVGAMNPLDRDGGPENTMSISVERNWLGMDLIIQEAVGRLLRRQ